MTTFDEPHPMMLLAYRVVVGIAVIAIPVVLTSMLDSQSRESDKLDQVVAAATELRASFSAHSQNIDRRVTNLERAIQERGVNVMTHHDFDRERELIDTRMGLLLESIEENSAQIDRLAESVDDICDALEGCSQ